MTKRREMPTMIWQLTKLLNCTPHDSPHEYNCTKFQTNYLQYPEPKRLIPKNKYQNTLPTTSTVTPKVKSNDLSKVQTLARRPQSFCQWNVNNTFLVTFQLNGDRCNKAEVSSWQQVNFERTRQQTSRSRFFLRHCWSTFTSITSMYVF